MEALQDFQLSQTIAGLWRLAIVVFVWAMVNQTSSLELRNVHFRSLSGSEPHTHGFCFSNRPNLLWRGIDLSDVFIYRVLKVHMYFFNLWLTGFCNVIICRKKTSSTMYRSYNGVAGMERAIGQRFCPAFLPQDSWENKICSTFLLPICNLFAAYQDVVSSRVHTVGLIVREVFDNINAMSAILGIKLSRRFGTRRTKASLGDLARDASHKLEQSGHNRL